MKTPDACWRPGNQREGTMRFFLAAVCMAGAVVATGTASSAAAADAPIGKPLSLTVGGAQPVPSSAPFGTFALSGAAALELRLPVDVRVLHISRLPSGITQTRYQQIVNGVPVYGGQF